MHPKLQQAIVATRAGKKSEAQLLLIETLQSNPEDANAWFLLGHLVEPEKRQIAYLEKALDIEPGHVKAKQRLMQLGAIPVPAPIVAEKAAQPTEVDDALPEPIAEIKTPAPPVKITPAAAADPAGLPAEQAEQAQEQKDSEVRKPTGRPKREKPQQTQPAQPIEVKAEQPKPSEAPKKKPGKRHFWLIGLLLLVILAIVLFVGYWLYVYFLGGI